MTLLTDKQLIQAFAKRDGFIIRLDGMDPDIISAPQYNFNIGEPGQVTRFGLVLHGPALPGPAKFALFDSASNNKVELEIPAGQSPAFTFATGPFLDLGIGTVFYVECTQAAGVSDPNSWVEPQVWVHTTY